MLREQTMLKTGYRLNYEVGTRNDASFRALKELSAEASFGEDARMRFVNDHQEVFPWK
jgi:hypothetical protein